MNTAAQPVSTDGFVIERGFRLLELSTMSGVDSESLDPDNVGDIADEGAGHRGSGRTPQGPSY